MITHAKVGTVGHDLYQVRIYLKHISSSLCCICNVTDITFENRIFLCEIHHATVQLKLQVFGYSITFDNFKALLSFCDDLPGNFQLQANLNS